MDAIDRLWQQIDTSLRRKAPPAVAQLAPAASQQAIERLEGVLGITLH